MDTLETVDKTEGRKAWKQLDLRDFESQKNLKNFLKKT